MPIRAISVAAVLALLTTGCSSSELSCSASKVVETAQGAARQAFAQDNEYKLFDADKSTFALSGIRTASCGERACECKATVRVTLELLDMFKQLAKSPQAEGYLRMTEQHYMQRTADFDISYRAELTDDNKEIYVTVEGM